MALKLPDSAVPMGDFPVAKAIDIDFNDGENLQEKLDNGKLGGGASSEKQIKDWVSGETYEIGDYVYYDGKLYRCITENSDVDFDETNWEKLTYGIDGLSKEDVERLLGLTKEEIEAMADLILDTEVRIDKTYSSSKIHADIQQCLEELEKVKIDDTLTTTDKTITGAINEVNGNLLDTVGFSADYKNIILNRKNGLNPYTIPISTIINNASLVELKDVDSTDVGDGKILVYDGITNKHKYVDSSITDEFVKMDSTSDANYLSDLIDKSTVVNDNGVLKVKKLDGQEVTITEINYLKGLTMNVMDLVNAFSNGGVKVWETPVNTYSDLETLDRSTFIDGISYIVYVLIDETHSNAKTTYLCTKTSTTFFGNADSQRNFTTNPIDLANEVTGKLGTSNIDVDNLWALLTINDTYKTLTTNNEIFGTHGAKAMYDELLTEIGAKANSTDLTTHIGDANIHVTTTNKAKWDKVTDKLDVADFNTHKDNTDIHITSAERTKLNKVADKVDKTDITTTIDSTSTDIQIPSAKAVFNSISSIGGVDNLTSLVLTTNLNDFKGTSFMIGRGLPSKTSNAPSGIDEAFVVEFFPYDTGDRYGVQRLTLVQANDNNYSTFERSLSNNVWRSWKRVCTTTVADVGLTSISMSSTYTKDADCKYQVINGICYIDFISGAYKIDSNVSEAVLATGLPIPKAGRVSVTYIPWGFSDSTEKQVILFIDGSGKMLLHAYSKVNNGSMFCSFSYPVA